MRACWGMPDRDVFEPHLVSYCDSSIREYVNNAGQNENNTSLS